MPEGQTEIYFLLAPTRESAEASPYYEVFKEKKWEVLFLTDPRDEFVMDHLGDFDSKKVVAAEKAEVKLDQPTDTEKLSDDEAAQLAAFMKETLGDRVNEVRASQRLVGSPAVVVDKDTGMTTSMRRVMKAMAQREGGASAFDSKPDLEINPSNSMMVKLGKIRETDSDLAKQVTEQVFDNALVAAGLMEDPRTMLARMNTLLERVLG
jgi:molecular chaperone HtpG